MIICLSFVGIVVLYLLVAAFRQDLKVPPSSAQAPVAPAVISAAAARRAGLLTAARNGQSEVVKSLLDAGTDQNSKLEYGDAALILAAEGGHSDVVKMLLAARADLNLKRKGGMTPLMIAAERGHLDVVKTLLDAKVDPNLKWEVGVDTEAKPGWATVEKPAWATVEPQPWPEDVVVPPRSGIGPPSERFPRFRWYVQYTPKDGSGPTRASVVDGLDSGSNGGRSRFQYYLETKNYTVEMRAIAKETDQGWEPRTETGLAPIKRIDGMTALMIAADNGHSEVVKILLDAGAVSEVKNKNGLTALDLAKNSACIEILREANRGYGVPAPQALKRSPAASETRVAETTHSDALLIGNKYELLRQIGEGGMGVVYEGRDNTLNRPVAVKKMRPEIKLNMREKNRFLQEAQTAAGLHHPFIVDIYAIIEEADEIYLIFEYVNGNTLEQVMEKAGRMGAEAAKPVLKCVCEALTFAHANKIVHRDLKPSNIMVTKQGHAKVMDFGIARQMKDTASRLTRVDSSGTMAYMAPEQELGKFDARSDIFSLGATVYELLSGELPFPGPNFLAQKERMTFRPLAEVAGEVPKEFAAAVERCLRFDPMERFQTVEEFARELGVA